MGKETNNLTALHEVSKTDLKHPDKSFSMDQFWGNERRTSKSSRI